MKSRPKLLAVWLVAAALLVRAAEPPKPVRLAADGWFRLESGELYVPLGGFHGNVLPLSFLNLPPEQYRSVAPYVWDAQKTGGQGHLDLLDASDEMLRRWFGYLADNGVTAVRLFPRARVSADVLDLCGKVNPGLMAAFDRAFTAARPFGIRFLLQIMPEPTLTGYLNREALERYVVPRFSKVELAALTPAQKRFVVERRTVSLHQWFSDPDVLACQKLYLQRALEWVASEPQIFALEIYNEQGWNTTQRGGRSFEQLEDAEIRWSAEIVRLVKERLPRMPVCLSHPGSGVTYYDPLKWAKGAGVDFYSSHLYAGQVGDSPQIDVAAVTGATGLIVGAGIVNFPGEWGIFDSPVPEPLRRSSYRDAIWLSLLARAPGFMQWTYEFPDEYRWPSKMIAELPPGFSPEAPSTAVEIGPEYRKFQTNCRYHSASMLREKQADENIQRIYGAYLRSLEIGAPIRFTMDGTGAIPLDRFASTKPRHFKRPIRALGGYQLTYLKDARSDTWLGYLRSRKIEGFGRHYVGVPREASLRIRFDLPKGRYRVRLIHLGENRVEDFPVGERTTIRVAKRTSDDFVLLLTRLRSPARR